MAFTINLRKRKKTIGKREVIVIVAAIILTTVGIKASDNIFNSPSNLRIEDKGQCPTGMVSVPSSTGDFCIDQYEASPGSDCPYSNPSDQGDTKANLDYPNCYPRSQAGAVPWRNVSQNQAALACAKAGKRLPTNKEWLQAALGTPDLDSGWGEEDCQVAENWENQPGLTGSGDRCVSSFGAFDMIGNVWEWVEGTINDGVYQGKILPNQGYINSVDEDGLPNETNTGLSDKNYNEDYFWIKTKETRAFARGGYWNNKTEAGLYSVYLVSPPSFVGTGVGFRCVK
jgi:formylglycine-generating enzyme required for sulfatase activity